jgi:uncharacterized protein
MERQAAKRLAWMPVGVEPGQHRRPFYTFLLKIASRCNLDCTYCYVYQGSDQSWRDRPRFMPPHVLQAAGERIADHVRQHHLDCVDIVFHGGEPLLIGARTFGVYAGTLRRLVPCLVNFGLQTNGTLLDEIWLETLAEHRVRIGISIDGAMSAHDRSRRYHSGEGSFSDVLANIERVRSKEKWAPLLGGFLAVVDLRNSPDEVYDFFRSIKAESIDLILPDAHHDALPFRPLGADGQIAYGAWMARFFDRWWDEQPDLDIRLFNEILVLMLGGPSAHESIGAKSVDLVVVEADGEIEPVDTLKVVGREATITGLNVMRNSFDEALNQPAILSRMSGYSSLCSTCQGCAHLAHCGGGYLPHRYSRKQGFQNPSVYCSDLCFLFEHMQQRIQEELRNRPPGGEG